MTYDANDKKENNAHTEKVKNYFRELHEQVEKLPKLKWDDSFSFKCHKGLSCWTECCHNPNLFLTPYDVLRIKNRLNITSSEFLEKHTETSIDPGFSLPVVRLVMKGKGACPFVTEDGCTLYEDRPTSCRLYPLGIAISSGTGDKHGERVHFKVEEEYCNGWQEKETWTVEKWLSDQQATDYNTYNEMITRMSFSPKLGVEEKLDEQKLGMFYMALYDIDKFKSFIFDTTFLKKFDVSDEIIDKIKTSDEELLRFSMRWVEFSVMGAPTMEVRKNESG